MNEYRRAARSRRGEEPRVPLRRGAVTLEMLGLGFFWIFSWEFFWISALECGDSGVLWIEEPMLNLEERYSYWRNKKKEEEKTKKQEEA